MSDREGQRELKTDEAFEALLGRAAPRPRPPRMHEEIVREVVHAEWRAATMQRRNRRLYYSIAASIVVALIVAVAMLPGAMDTVTLEQVASIEKRVGDVTISDRSVTTGSDAFVALSWINGGSLRVDEETRITVESPGEVFLHSGRVYFDSQPIAMVDPMPNPGDVVLRIRTGSGVVTPLGTRFLAQTGRDGLSVMVREGEVSIAGSGFSSTAVAGQRLNSRAGGAPTITNVRSYGGDWTWVERTSPPIDTEGRSVYEFLTWVGRESGRSLSFGSDAVETLARTSLIRGYGRIDLEPSIALRVVMLSTDLDWRIEGAEIIIVEKVPVGHRT